MGEIQSKIEEIFYETSKPEGLSFETSKLNTLIIDERFNHISQRILSNLDHKAHQRIRLVCQSWNKQVDNPYFWIKKCKKTNQPKSLHLAWIELHQKIEENDLPDQDFKECLMKWYRVLSRNTPQEHFEGILPIHVIAILGILGLFEIIASYVDNLNPTTTNGYTPIHLAAWYGQTELFKLLAPKIKSLNEPNSDYGYTPIFLAAKAGKIDIVKFLISKVENPNAAIFVDFEDNWTHMTPMEIAEIQGRKEIVEFFQQYEQYETFRTKYMLN